MKKALVIGFGSIGRLHCTILESLGYQVSVVSKHCNTRSGVYADVSSIDGSKYSYAVIASATFNHERHLTKLRQAGYEGKVLVEKPIFMKRSSVPISGSDKVFVGYNLRYHPCISAFLEYASGEKILTVHHYIGQHLSQWRPDTNHLDSYSAQKTKGGGVLRDLSHELDLMNFLFGHPIDVKGIGGKVGNVTQDAEDAFGMVLKTESCPLITLQMNCLDHHGKRQMKVVCENTSFDLDFTEAVIRSGNDEESFQVERETTYRSMHEDVLGAAPEKACTYDQGVEILRLIESLEA